MRPAASALALLAAALLGACELAELSDPAPEPAASEAAPEPESPPASESPSETDLAVDPSVALPLPGTAAPADAGSESSGSESSGTAPPGTGAPDTPARPPAPHIYLALQPGGTGRPASAVFAIDAARDGTPSDDPAIRLTPEAGRCNPQDMRRYDFPPDAAPVVSDAEQARGLTARDLPRFLAAAVTGRMIEAGLATEPEDTRPLNVCTRKLWERLVIAENPDRAAAAQ